MEKVFLSTGIACIIAAIVGGGFKAFGVEIPALSSLPRQMILGSFGIVLIFSPSLSLISESDKLDKTYSTVPMPMSSERINFQRGSSSYSFTVNLIKGGSKGYILRIKESQHMIITFTDNAKIAVMDQGNNILAPISAEKRQLEMLIPRTGDYSVVVAGEGTIAVKIYIPPLT